MKAVNICILSLSLAGGSVCLGQDNLPLPDGGWIGEWGAYTTVPAHGLTVRQYRGERIAISDCTGNRCKLKMDVQTDAGHCDSANEGTVTIQSPSIAVASLGEDRCRVNLQKDGMESAPRINTDKGSAGCSDFCTSGAALNRTFPLRAHTQYFGDDIESCYLGASTAQMAICNSRPLAEHEHAWRMLALEMADLEGKNALKESDPAKLLAQCDSATGAERCMNSALDASIANLNQRKEAWMRQVTEPGNPKKAAATIVALAGTYRHNFTSGDVQGATLKVVDKMHIAGVSSTSIHYSLYLNFYNGHTCSREGVAVYKANGAFVEQVEDDAAGICYFEIVPTGKGLTLRDPTGACKIQSCGERGGYNGAGFSFTQKVRTSRRPKIRSAQ